MDPQPLKDTAMVPVLFCERQKKWLPVEKHTDCEFCAAPVYDEGGDPVSFLCTYFGEKRVVQEDHEDPAEEGRGPPSTPDALG